MTRPADPADDGPVRRAAQVRGRVLAIDERSESGGRGPARSPGGEGARPLSIDWRLGGKTGTGPFGAEPHDGWFAGLIFDRGVPRYTVAVYVERRGPGGGVAAGIAAEIVRLLAARP